MAMEPTAPCPHCRAENMAHRRTCWRCKRTLPTSFALDAELLAARSRLGNPSTTNPPTQKEIDSALEQAMVQDAELLGDTQHAVYLTDTSVVFVFLGRDAAHTVERLMRSPAVWRASLAWRGCAAGRPHPIDTELIPATEPLYTSPGE